MKKITLILLVTMTAVSVSAQVPQAMNYQAIARNSMGQIVPSQSIGIRFTVLDLTGTTILYQETQTSITNNFGLFTLAIGKGTPVSGTFAAIDWAAAGDKYLKVEIAPQGGTNYTIQGISQLLSVPYALYSEKTKMIGGNAITITNGNTISANYIAGTGIAINGNTIAGNYQAGPGITINGNTISATAANAWLLNGNTGTTAAHFLGTTDNLALRFRVNNSERFSISPTTAVGTYNVSYMTAGDPSATSNNPIQFSINGKDISGSMLPLWVNTSVVGMTWSQVGGTNNTLGRLARWTQWTSNTNFQFYDQGIDQEGDYFITERGLSGSGGTLPKKMLQISSTNNVGINMDWAENPTANFHTKGTVRFEGINANNTLTRLLVMDANGNVSSRDASTLSGVAGNDWSLLGNSGTTAANFLGTIDNQKLNFRTNNITRMYLDQSNSAFGADIGTLFLSDETNVSTRPAQLALYGRDIAGASLPLLIASYVGGATWGVSGGNTSGRFIRFSQMNTSIITQSHFYDLGMSQDSSLYFGNHGFQNIGGVTSKKMITISPQDMVGINLNMVEKPTANFHTKGTLRFEGIATNNALTRVVVMDNNGNVSSRDASTIGGASNAWQTTGNSGTNSLNNFVGTSDDQRLAFRTNNITRMYLDKTNAGFGADVGTLFLSDEANIQARPAQLAVFGRDIAGVSLPTVLVNSVAGSTWGVAGGNTLGRLIRFSQMNTASFTQSHFYDLGISQDSSFYLGNHGFQNTGGVIPKKMITISPEDRVGIKLDWTEKPTADFHTKGTVRFQNLPSGTGNILVVDNNGNVFRASQTASKSTTDSQAITDLQNELTEAKKEIAVLKAMISDIQKTLNMNAKK